ncbi:MAG: carboxynorspermidine decarboxylase [Chitinophagales bacterium]
MPINFTKIPTPTFVLEEEKLIKNLEKIKYVADAANVQIIMALKGFAMYSVFPLIKKHVKATTASSINEARLAYEEFGEEVHAYAPVYLENELEDWAKYCSHLTFNSLSQYERFYEKLSILNKNIEFGIRVNPEYSEVSTDLYNPCISGSRLGVRAKDLPTKLPRGITGLHFHTLCENNSYTLENTLKAFTQKFDGLIKQCAWVNFGGGHLMTHKDYDIEHVIKVLKKFKEQYPHIKVIMEPGAAFAWQTGYLVAKVEDVIDSDGVEAIIMDASVAAHMPDCIEMPYTPSIKGAKIAEGKEKRTRIGGTSCLAGDFVGDYYFEKPLKIGDKLIFEDMMHYTMVKTTFFNGVKHPNIGIWKKEGVFELVKSFGYESFKEKLS